MGIRVTGVGSYVPDQRLTNEELARRVDASHEWITARTGIRERRISAPAETPSDMACEAAERCLMQAGIAKSAVDLIVVACASPDQIQPAVACLVQEKLGMSPGRCPASARPLDVLAVHDARVARCRPPAIRSRFSIGMTSKSVNPTARSCCTKARALPTSTIDSRSGRI